MRIVSVHDSYTPVRHSVDIPYDDSYNPQAYEYSTPYLCPEELGDIYAEAEHQWDIEVQAYEEQWDSVPEFQPPSVFRGLSKPAPYVDYAEANHLYIGAATAAHIKMMKIGARRVNYNPPKRRMSTSTTVPVVKKEVPATPTPQKPRHVGVTKRGKSIRIPLDQLPLYKYRGWEKMAV